MKYIILIIDGAAGLPLPDRGGRTCLEIADTPNLDILAGQGTAGLVRTVPPGMEPSSACACMSLLGYDPEVYYSGRAAIEALSMDVPVGEGEVVFRCNLITTGNGKMSSYSAGHISTGESAPLIAVLNEKLGSEDIHFYNGINYRHICKLRGAGDTLMATCTPPHDIPDRDIREFLPHGEGSPLLRKLMEDSIEALRNHPVNIKRIANSDLPANMIWLFWGSSKLPAVPSFKQLHGLDAAMTSGVDLLQGLSKMASIDILNIPGVTDGLDNDFTAQAEGALGALEWYDMVIIHVEAPDEAAHSGDIDDKVEAIQKVDTEIVGRILQWNSDTLRVMVLPDHPTPISTRTHSDEPVPFILRGDGFTSNGARYFSEAEAKKTDLFIEHGCDIICRLIGE